MFTILFRQVSFCTPPAASASSGASSTRLILMMTKVMMGWQAQADWRTERDTSGLRPKRLRAWPVPTSSSPSARRLHTNSPLHSLFFEPGGRARPRPFKGRVVRLPHEAANSKLTSFKTVVTLGHANGVALQTVHDTSQCQQSKQNLQLPPRTPRTLRLSRRGRSLGGGRCKSIGHYDNEPIHGLVRRKCFCIPRCRWSTNSWRPRKSCRSTCRIPTSSVSIRSPAQCSSSHRQSHRRQHRIEATP